jgi:hypothetical protein
MITKHIFYQNLNLSKKYSFVYPHIQQDEINKMHDEKKNICINKIISIIGIKRVFSSCAIIGIDEQSKRGFIDPNIGMYELVNDDDDGDVDFTNFRKTPKIYGF